MKQYFINLYDYNYWATEKILLQVEKVSHEQFAAPTSNSWGSLRGTLTHALTAEWIWRERLQGNSPDHLLDEDNSFDAAALKSRWDEESADMRAYLQSLNEKDIGNTIQFVTTKGEQRKIIVSDVLTHVVLHSMQYRAEAAVILTDYGHSPGDIDFLLYLHEKQDKQ